MEKKARLNAQLFCAHIRWSSRCAKGLCSADPECTQHSSIPKSEASVLIDLTTKSAKKLAVEPPATVGLVRPAKESDCTVTDCGSHVKRVLTLSDALILTLAFSSFFLGTAGC